MTARPYVTVQLGTDPKKPVQIQTPKVFESPIRLDVVNTVFRDLNKNHRQAYAVSKYAGHQTSAESWGTGRAVARIPRVAGGGTHRAGQGAFGNMCRGGRMFAPTKTWRRWHRRVNINQRRFAVASALAASAVPALVMARGHRIEQIPEVPLVISNESIKNLAKTSQAITLLEKLSAYDDVERVKKSANLRAGKGKYRNRRYTQRRGPLVVLEKKNEISRAFRNIPGVEIAYVERLNLLQLAPGGHIGRFVIWTQAAFHKLDTVYGVRGKVGHKQDYVLPRSLLKNPDVTRIINSDEIQSVLRPIIKQKKFQVRKKNPLKNLGALVKLNPYAKTARRKDVLAEEKRKEKRAQLVEAKRKGVPATKTSATKTPVTKPAKPTEVKKKWVKQLLS